MDKHPNQYLNELVAVYALHYLQQVYWQKTGSHINNAVWSFLERAGISPFANPDTLTGHYLILEAAYHQKDLAPSETFRNIVRQQPHLKPLVAHGPQALLIYSYLPLLESLFALDKGEKRYGYCKEVYRNIEDNVRAARLMFERASSDLANKIFELYGDYLALALFEGGAGNGAATLTILKKFLDSGKKPFFLLSDLDEATKKTAEELFRSHGFTEPLPWLKVDLGSHSDLQKVERKLLGYYVVVSVNFILHEYEGIAEKFFEALNNSLPHAKLAITEFFLPENGVIDPRIPEWFIFLHQASGQFLRTEKEFLSIATKHGYRILDRLDHQKINDKPLISTLFLEK